MYAFEVGTFGITKAPVECVLSNADASILTRHACRGHEHILARGARGRASLPLLSCCMWGVMATGVSCDMLHMACMHLWPCAQFATQRAHLHPCLHAHIIACWEVNMCRMLLPMSSCSFTMNSSSTRVQGLPPFLPGGCCIFFL